LLEPVGAVSKALEEKMALLGTIDFSMEGYVLAAGGNELNMVFLFSEFAKRLVCCYFTDPNLVNRPDFFEELAEALDAKNTMPALDQCSYFAELNKLTDLQKVGGNSGIQSN